MKFLRRSWRVLALCAMAAVLFTSVPAMAQTIESGIQDTENRLTEAKRARLHIIAPRTFEEAQSSLARTKERFARGGKIDEIADGLAEVNEKLDRCDQLQAMGDLLLRDTFVARDDAIAVNAPRFATEPWKEAEETIRDAGQSIEDGEQNDAREEAARARGLYRDAELLAIRTNILGSARTERSRAVEAKADEYARVTLADADRDLASAEAILQGDRYMKAQALELAESARQSFRHAASIAATAVKVEKDRKGRIEDLIRSHETQFERVARVLDYEPDFAGGIEPAADQSVAAVTSLVDDRAQLVAQVHGLQAEIERLNGDLALLQDRDETLQQKEQYDRKVREVRGIYEPDEAEVLLGDDELIVRLYALSFPVGSSEIRPENFSLLTRVQRTLREFPTADIVIEGHTDAQGDETMNQALSDRRAEAVRTYLLANMGIDAQRVVARGYGESRPIANNESESGRARNRRIDVVVRLSNVPF